MLTSSINKTRMIKQVTVLGIDDNPVEARCCRHLADRGELEGDPKTVYRKSIAEFLAEGTKGIRVHSLYSN